MSFSARLKIDGKDLRVLEASYTLGRDVDFSGRPSGDVRGGRVLVTIEGSDYTGFYEWLIDPYALKEGSIVFKKRDDDATAKELVFKDAYLIRRTENFTQTGDNPLTETLEFSARELSLGGGTHENEWPS
ncbi:MAG: type VI secretion system tube protein TssD [Chitinophagales bacterium]